MIKFEITDEMRRNTEERLKKMGGSAETAFDELFPTLDYVNGFLRNKNIIDITYMYEIVDRAVHRQATFEIWIGKKSFEADGQENTVLDFTSMYPSVGGVLTGLWGYMISTGYEKVEATEEHV